jgi:hypothetical protein
MPIEQRGQIICNSVINQFTRENVMNLEAKGIVKI